MRTFHKVANFYGVDAAVFRVPTFERGDVFMRISRTRYRNDQRAVVEVDSQKFLGLWRNEPYSIHQGISSGTILSWKLATEFPDVDVAFQHGEADPVELTLSSWPMSGARSAKRSAPSGRASSCSCASYKAMKSTRALTFRSATASRALYG
jgi:hypothetical protein